MSASRLRFLVACSRSVAAERRLDSSAARRARSSASRISCSALRFATAIASSAACWAETRVFFSIASALRLVATVSSSSRHALPEGAVLAVEPVDGLGDLVQEIVHLFLVVAAPGVVELLLVDVRGLKLHA